MPAESGYDLIFSKPQGKNALTRVLISSLIASIFITLMNK